MSVSGISMYSSSASRLNAIPIREDHNSKTGQLTDIEDAGIQKQDQPDRKATPERNNAPRTSNAEDFTFDFKKNSYQLVAARTDLEDIDVEKAMSDMKKDTILDQYKFFVKPANLATDEDGTVKLVNRG